MFWIFLTSLLPMILFAVIDYYSDLKKGIYGAVLVSILSGILFSYVMGEVRYEIVFAVIVMIVTGYYSQKSEDALYFKLQPVVVSFSLLLVFLWFQIFDVPIMVKMAPKAVTLLPEAKRSFFLSHEGQLMLSRMSIWAMLAFALHGIWVAYAAIHKSTKFWVVVKSLGAPIIAIICIVMERLWQRFGM